MDTHHLDRRSDPGARLSGLPMILAWAVAGCSSEVDPCARDARPATIDETLATIATLPSPVTLDCFLVSLERPLGLELTTNIFSAQPADGSESPRIFLRTDELAMSVVPVGTGRRLLEFGETQPTGLTLKAELEFPIVLPLDPNAPYDRVLSVSGPTATGCGVCHASEVEVGEGRFASTPLRPRSSTLVSIDTLLDSHATCDPEVDAYRCSMLSALFDHGDVFHAPFPDDMPVLTFE